MNRPWKSYFLAYDENGVIISGGASQGIKVGDIFDAFIKGKKVKNPQTGISIELPGRKVGQIQVDYLGGENPQNEFSLVSFINGQINQDDLTKYYIKEIKK
jgi:hypothetical protein